MRLGHFVAILSDGGGDELQFIACRRSFTGSRSAGANDLLQHLVLQPVHAEDADAIPVEEK